MTVRVFLTDFGLAKDTATGSKFTRTGTTLGTPAYMSPELARGEFAALTPASDVWALGCVCYEMLSGGRRAFAGETPAAVIGAVLTTAPAPLVGVERNAATAAAACLQRGTAARYQAAGALRDDCDRVLAGLAPAHRLPRGPGLVRAGLVVAAVGLLAIAAWLGARGRAVGPPEGGGPGGAQALAAQGWALRTLDTRRGAELLRRAIAEAPDHGEWRVQRGLLLWAAGNLDAARREWDAVPETDAQWPVARLYLGLERVFLHDGERFAAADGVPFLTAVRARGDRIGQLARAAIHLADKRPAQVAPALAGVTGWEAELLRAHALEFRSAPAERLPHYDAALADGIPFAWALSNRGLARKDAGDLDGAEADYTAALREHPGYLIARHNRAILRTARGLDALALEDLNAILVVAPHDPMALSGRALIHSRRGEHAAAVADCTAALAQRPDYPEARTNRGNALLALGDLEGAEADYAAVIDAHPEFVKALYGRALVRQRRGDLAGACAGHTAALAADASFAPSYAHRGDLLRRMGRPDEARRDLDRAVALAPDDARMLGMRATLRHATRDLSGAVADLTAAVRLDAADPSLWLNLGTLRSMVGDQDGAEAALSESLRLRPDQPDALASRGLARLRAGRWPASIADLTHALEIAAPDWPGRAQATRMLSDARQRLAAAGE